MVCFYCCVMVDCWDDEFDWWVGDFVFYLVWFWLLVVGVGDCLVG